MILKNNGIRLMVSAVCVFLFAFSIGKSEDWPRWRGPNGNGISNETDWDPMALANGVSILWRAEVGYGYSNVAIQGNRLFTMGSGKGKSSVTCINPANGKQIWQFRIDDVNGPVSTPQADGEFVYALTYNGHLYCFNARNGKVQWNKHLEKEYGVKRPVYGFSSSPVTEGNLLILTGNLHGIALDKKTGNEVWSSPQGAVIKSLGGDYWTGNAYATPVFYFQNGKQYAAIFNTHGLNSVDIQTGKTNWFQPWSAKTSENVADPLISDGKIFISTGNNMGCALLDVNTGKPKVIWQNKNMSNHFSTCVFINGYIYGCHGQAGFDAGTLRCLDIKSGNVTWEKDFGRPVCLSAANGMLIILEDKGTLHIAEASPASYKELSSGAIAKGEKTPAKYWTTPILCNGRIYCRNWSGTITCVDMRKK